MRIHAEDGAELVTLEEIAEQLGVVPTTLHAYRSRGRMPEAAGSVGRTLVWRSPAIQRWISERSGGDPVPAELRQLDRWVLWRRVERDGKPTKLPLQARVNRCASSTDPATWASYSETLKAFAHRSSDGIGFVLNGDGIIGVDLDHCLAGETLMAWAARLLKLAPTTYVEISPSGTGLRIFAHGDVPRGRVIPRPKGGQVEIYGSGRYLTVTGRRFADAPSVLGDASALVEALEALA